MRNTNKSFSNNLTFNLIILLFGRNNFLNLKFVNFYNVITLAAKIVSALNISSERHLHRGKFIIVVNKKNLLTEADPASIHNLIFNKNLLCNVIDFSRYAGGWDDGVLSKWSTRSDCM